MGAGAPAVLPAIDTSGYAKEDWRALPALCEARVRQGLAALRAEQAAPRPPQGA